jgi:hypothetical protein
VASAAEAQNRPNSGRLSSLKKLGLIAGNGRFPILFAAQARRDGFTVIAVAHRGETPPEIENVADEVTWVYVGQLGKIIRVFLRAGVTEAVMAGGIRKAKLFVNFRPDLRGARFLARVRKRDDDALLRGIAEELEQDGIKIMESTVCVPEILPGEGVLTKRPPTAAEWEDIRFGFSVAKEMGRLGVGQTVIVKDRVIVAVEAVEGTDAAIERAGKLAKSGCVMVKVSKPGQDLRFDVPAVGVDTMRNLHKAGGAVLAVEAGKTILLEKEELLRTADELGIAVVAIGDEAQGALPIS